MKVKTERKRIKLCADFPSQRENEPKKPGGPNPLGQAKRGKGKGGVPNQIPRENGKNCKRIKGK